MSIKDNVINLVLYKRIKEDFLKNIQFEKKCKFLQKTLDISKNILYNLGSQTDAGVAQLVEHLICNQAVGGSSPFASSICETVFDQK